jgi:hypothetical protein
MAFTSCFVAIGLSLTTLGLPIAVSLGVLAATVTPVLVLWVDRRIALSA